MVTGDAWEQTGEIVKRLGDKKKSEGAPFGAAFFLCREGVVVSARFERATFRFGGEHSIQLSYETNRIPPISAGFCCKPLSLPSFSMALIQGSAFGGDHTIWLR